MAQCQGDQRLGRITGSWVGVKMELGGWVATLALWLHHVEIFPVRVPPPFLVL